MNFKKREKENVGTERRFWKSEGRVIEDNLFFLMFVFVLM